MVLCNLYRPGKGSIFDISISGDIIGCISPKINSDDQVQYTFNHAMCFPGLINSHDHLDFDLFPQLGDGAYTNYVQWGPAIQKQYSSIITKVQAIPENVRTRWGMYKNLLSGITTVVHHGKKVKVDEPLINILQHEQSIHSVKFEKWWKLRMNNFLNSRRLCVMHAGEGTDGDAVAEIDELIKWNLLKRKLVAVHGVAMTEKQAARFEALIWCPTSNMFLFGKTAAIDGLKKLTNVCLGTDSTLTSGWNIWEHLREARRSGLVNDEELYKMISVNPKNLWKINTGELAENKKADIVIAEGVGSDWDSFYSINPENILLIIHDGRIRLCDESICSLLNNGEGAYDKINIGERIKYVAGGMAILVKEIRKYLPSVTFPFSIIEN